MYNSKFLFNFTIKSDYYLNILKIEIWMKIIQK